MSSPHAGMLSSYLTSTDKADPVSPKTTTHAMPDVSSLSISNNAGNGAGANANAEEDPATVLSLRALVSTKEAGIIIGKFCQQWFACRFCCSDVRIWLLYHMVDGRQPSSLIAVLWGVNEPILAV